MKCSSLYTENNIFLLTWTILFRINKQKSEMKFKFFFYSIIRLPDIESLKSLQNTTRLTAACFQKNLACYQCSFETLFKGFVLVLYLTYYLSVKGYGGYKSGARGSAAANSQPQTGQCATKF